MVSVSIITYNQEKYIAKAIESVLAQNVAFKYEIIIGDDCSSDGTREILKKYEQKYPDTIQLILHPRRYDEIPGRTNNMTNLYNCRGKYIAMLDGDDYWVSTTKLQKQVNFLEHNSDYALTFHDVLEITEDGSAEDRYHHEQFDFLDKSASFEQKDLALTWFMPTSSLLFKNNFGGEFPEWFREVYSADYALQLLVTQHGKIYYFKDLLSVRLANAASFSAKIKNTNGYYKMIIQERIHFNTVFPHLNFKEKIASAYLGYAQYLFLERSYRQSLLNLYKSSLLKPRYLYKPISSAKRKLVKKIKPKP